VTCEPGYLAQVDPDALDASRFERLVNEGRGRGRKGDLRRASRVLSEALSLWRGPALAEFADEPFAQPVITRLDELRLAALRERIEDDLALGRHEELVPELQELARTHPLQERFRCQLMLALYRSGRQADALEVARSTRRVLDDELGIDPGPALRDMETAILTQDPTLAPPDPSPVVFAGY
jgi:DNA-binding SARP family transcriptional activator